MVSTSPFSKGLGQLEAYIGAAEGVAFEMDNGLFWDSLHDGSQWTVKGVTARRRSSKFWVTILPSGKVMLQNWLGMFLAPVKVETCPETFPVQAVLYSQDPSLYFDVYFNGDCVAFRSHDGHFLSRVHRDFSGLEAVTFFADYRCCFRPFVGDLIPPTFHILSVAPNDLSGVSYQRYFLRREHFFNWGYVPVRHTFVMTWETYCIDKVAWQRLWGLGIPSCCSFTVGDAKPMVQYTKHNEDTLSVIRKISEWQTAEVVVPPRNRAIASLYVHMNNPAVVPFTAVVRKKKPNGDISVLYEIGAWKGLAYQDLRIKIRLESLNLVSTEV